MNEIIKEPNNLLHQKCEPFRDFQEPRRIADELIQTIKNTRTKYWTAWGFAANQIGYAKRVIVLRMGRDKYLAMVNPVFIEKRFPFPYVEGCYSVKGKYLVKRYLWAKVKFQDLQGDFQEMIFKGFSAIYQEMDHMNGVLVSQIGRRVI